MMLKTAESKLEDMMVDELGSVLEREFAARISQAHMDPTTRVMDVVIVVPEQLSRSDRHALLSAMADYEGKRDEFSTNPQFVSAEQQAE